MSLGNVNMSEALIKNGASVNTVGNHEATPLHVAAEYGERHGINHVQSCVK